MYSISLVKSHEIQFDYLTDLYEDQLVQDYAFFELCNPFNSEENTLVAFDLELYRVVAITGDLPIKTAEDAIKARLYGLQYSIL